MQWSVVLLSLLCSTSCFAKRLFDQAIATLEPNIDGTDGSQGISDEDGEPPCVQEASLRAVLESLGVPDDQLQNVQSFPGVHWKGCDVTIINFPGEKLHGSLAKEFRELRALEDLTLPDGNITGNLDVLKENAALIYLNLTNARISGNLQSLAKATGLKMLWLKRTQVSGDVVALSNAKGLWQLDLSETQVSGEIAGLTTAKDLGELDLSETKVSGDVVAFRNATGLKKLVLSKTKVYGDVVALENAKGLEHLDFSETKVHGDLGSLANLTDLKTLQLSNTNVSGDYSSVIWQWKKIRYLGLSGTEVTSHPTKKCNSIKHLKTLDLAWSKIDIVDGFLANFVSYNSLEREFNCPFPALMTLNITGTALNTTVGKLLKPFLGCKELRIFKAAECSLTGQMPNHITEIGFWEEEQDSEIEDWPLSKVLELLDLSSNNVTKVEALPGNCRAVSFRDNPQISFGEDVVKEATEHFVSLDLRNATFAHPSEVTDLFDSSVIKQNRARTVINLQHGFECYDLDSTSIQITPETFAPDRLCSCSPGWKGSGAKCKKCPENSFAENYDSKECEQCPQGSKAPAGSTSHTSCICNVGVLDNRTGQWRCGCREHEAVLDETCVKCSDFHLSCPSHGTQVFSAQPLKGYTRLKNETHAFKCLKPDIRCDAEHVDSDVVTHNGSTLGACREGYTDVMCMDCAPKYFPSDNQCERCQDSTTFSNGAPIMVAAIVVILAVIGGGIWLWVHRNRHAEVRQEQQGPSASGALKEQLKAQVPILLQLCQLWPVLAVLAAKTGNGPEQDTNTMQDHGGNEGVGFASAFWEVPYVQALQLSISSLKGAFNLQCKFDGAMVRFIAALVAPVVPLTVMLCCMLLELLKPGSGINAGLQALTLLYIGGASSTSSLLSCQEVDGAGDNLPRQFAFRTAMPYILCHEESKLKHSVDTLAFSSAFFYGIIIPCCLLYLYGRQHVLFQSNRTTVAIVADHGSLKVSVSKVLESTVQKTGNVEFTRRLVAAAAASISVLCRGKVSLRVADGSALIEPLDGSINAASDQLEPDLLSFIDAEDAKQQAKQQKCWSLCKMLTERSILQDVAPSDRLVSGAKTLLLKYALCRNIWMEIAQKLVAVFLVSVVASANGLQLSVAVTLTMAATSAMVQPYARPQVNRLHCCSFICLAMAAASFANTWVWTSRAALAGPFLLTAAQSLRPDSLENLAIRLWEELEPQIEALQRGEPVEVTSETYNFF